jgi:16S rRNA U516 pseudouridylate synthase RsuA-like enzyme
MAAVLGYRVLRLKRCAIGRLLLGELPVGVSVALDRDQLWKMVKHGGIL